MLGCHAIISLTMPLVWGFRAWPVPGIPCRRKRNPHSETRKHKPKTKTNFYINNLYFRNIFHAAERNRVLICVIIFRNYSHPKRRSCNCHCPIHKAEIMKMFPSKLFLVFSLHSVYEKSICSAIMKIKFPSKLIKGIVRNE